MTGKVWIVITWDEGMPKIISYEDGDEAVELYRYASYMKDSAFLYATDESGSMELILEHEALPKGRR